MDVAWGGIWGHVLLEARADAWLSDLFVQPDVADSSCSASATLNGKADLPDAAKLEVFDKSGRRVAETAAEGRSQDRRRNSRLPSRRRLPDAKLWTPDSPTLYTARLSLLKGGQVLDTVESRFGMRQFTIDGYHLLLNGKRIMLRGYGDDHIYPEQMAMPSDKELHLKRLRIIKSYGFNHVRHHSTIMPPEYYDACDEVGMITTAEFPIAYQIFLPGVGANWKAHVPPGTDPGPALETYRREWAAAIKRHPKPSLDPVLGHGQRIVRTMRFRCCESISPRIARQLDPAAILRRFGRRWLDNALSDPKNDRDTLRLLLRPVRRIRRNPIDNPASSNRPGRRSPCISHEAGNYVTFSRPDLVDQFQHNIKPFWLTAGKAKLEKLGLLQEANGWAEKSERLYVLCHKYNLEVAPQESLYLRLSLVAVPGLLDQLQRDRRPLLPPQVDHQGRGAEVQQRRRAAPRRVGADLSRQESP